MVYLEKGIPAITISSKDEIYSHRTQKFSVFDTSLSTSDLKQNILIISEALIKVIYSFGEKNFNYFIDNEQAVSDDFLTQIKGFMQKTSRAPHLIQRDTLVSKEFFKLMQQNLGSVKRMGVAIKDTIFFDEPRSYKVQLHTVTSRLMELYVFFAILSYLICLYFVLQKVSGMQFQKKEKQQ
jgi:hypothetical protein